MSEPRGSASSEQRRGGVGRTLLLVHAGLVAALLLAYVIMTATHPGPDANIGAGIVGLVLLVLGLPWTFPVLIGSGEPDGMRILIRLAPAVVNVALHAAARLVVLGQRRH